MSQLHRHRLIKKWLIQLISFLVINPNFSGLFKGTIYQGKAKFACVSVLNCYSCPMAIFSCPLGAIQNFFASVRASIPQGVYQVGLYPIAFLIAVGSVFGRATCGWVCPFGALQDLLYKIKIPKLPVPRMFRPARYLFLALTIFLLPALIVDMFGYGAVWFCKWICPSGTLGAGIPLVAANGDYRALIGVQFWVKVAILIFFLIWMIPSRRPFCQTTCPLGAILGLTNKFSLFRMNVDRETCIRCDRCFRSCPMELRIYENSSDSNCIRCLKCKHVCPVGAVSSGFGHRENRETVGA